MAPGEHECHESSVESILISIAASSLSKFLACSIFRRMRSMLPSTHASHHDGVA